MENYGDALNGLHPLSVANRSEKTTVFSTAPSLFLPCLCSPGRVTQLCIVVLKAVYWRKVEIGQHWLPGRSAKETFYERPFP